MVTRRDALAGAGSLAAAALAGCTSSIPGVGGGGRGAYTDWLGPEMAKLQAPVYGSTDVSRLAGFVAGRPAEAASAAALPSVMAESWTTDLTTLPLAGTDVTVPPGDVDVAVQDVQGTYSVLEGSFGPDAVIPGAESATVDAEHRGFDLYALPPSPGLVGTDDPDVLSELATGLAVADGTAAVAHLAESDEQALEFARALVDTGTGDAPRYETEVRDARRLFETFGDATYVSVGSVGPDVEMSAGAAATLDGDRTHRVGAQFFETAEAAADSRYTDEEYIASLKTPSDVGADARLRDGKFAVYDSVSVSRDGRLVTVEGTLPTAELAPVDLSLP